MRELTIEQQIMDCRSVSQDGTVTYDLSRGVSFSNPRKTAEAFADVFYRIDVSNWIKWQDNKLEFDPKYRARIVIGEDHNHHVKKTLDEFFQDIEEDEILPVYASRILKAIDYESGVMPYVLGGLFWGAEIEEREELQQEHQYVAKVVQSIRDNIAIEHAESN